MPARRHFSRPLIALLLTSGLAFGATAVPLAYAVDADASNVSVVMATNGSLDATPDLTEGTINGEQGQLPLTAGTVNSTDTLPGPNSNAVADVGLPASFNGGANGITFSELEIDLPGLPGPINNFTGSTSLLGLGIGAGGPLGLPFGIVESSVILFTAAVQMSSLNIILDQPFSSSLTENPLQPGEYLWAGLANATLSGVFTPTLLIPGNPVGTPPIPFSIPVTGLPLAGTFSGDANGTEIVVGFDPDQLAAFLENQDLSTDPVAYQFEVPLADLLADLGLSQLQLLGIVALLGDSISASFSHENLLLLDANTGVHFTNATPIPEPGTAALLGLGIAILAAARRRRPEA